MRHLLKGEVREAPTSERSFLAGETERVFEAPIGSLGTSFITVLEMLPNKVTGSLLRKSEKVFCLLFCPLS
jgi:hypothetical protein